MPLGQTNQSATETARPEKPSRSAHRKLACATSQTGFTRRPGLVGVASCILDVLSDGFG